MKSIINEEFLIPETTMIDLKERGVAVGEIDGRSPLFDEVRKQFGSYLKHCTLVGRFIGAQTAIDFIESGGMGQGIAGTKIRRGDSSRKLASSSWTRYSTWDEAVKKMKHNPEVFRKFNESDIALTDEETAGRGVSYDTSGDYLDVGRALAGEPECFGVMEDGKVQNKYCSIVISGGIRFGAEASMIDYRSMRITRLVDMLEANNIRCEVNLVFACQESYMEVLVKSYNDPLELDSIAMACSSDFFRRMNFAFSEYSREHDDSYGRARDTDIETMETPDSPQHMIGISSQGFIDEHSVQLAFDALEEVIQRDGLPEKYQVGELDN